MRALEELAFNRGDSAESLMEEAGARIAEAVQEFCPAPGRCRVFFGKGHNGGDALVAARYLALAGWRIELEPAFGEECWSDLTRKNFRALEAVPLGKGGTALVILDGLLGIGATGPLREPILSAAQSIRTTRASGDAIVFALDLPTGLDADSGAADPATVEADFTLTIGFAKRGLIRDDATRYVGRLCVLPLSALEQKEAGRGCRDREERGQDAHSPFSSFSSTTVATGSSLAALLPRRGFDSHKGDFGRIAILAGSSGMTGAAVLAANGCVKAGGGLVTLYTLEELAPLIASMARPEVMVKPVRSYLELLDARFDVLAIGPGLGPLHWDDIRTLIRSVPRPMIVDADALNALAEERAILDQCKGPRLLTPHPGEMQRLDPQSASRPRQESVDAFIAGTVHTLLLKGARTIVAERGSPVSYNSTGSPGMATGGMGDVLTGVCAAMAGQRLPLYDAARVGAWVCGRAAELAIYRGNQSEESLVATDVIAHLGSAFKELRAGLF